MMVQGEIFMLEIANKLFSRWNSEGIIYCHFKSNQHLHAGLNGDTDLDILINDKDKEKCGKILLDLKFKQFEPVTIGRYPGVSNWYGFDKERGKFIHVHLHYQLATGKGLVKDYVIPWTSAILNNSILDQSSGVMICDPNYEYVLLCTRIIVKRKLRDNILSIGRKAFIHTSVKIELDYLRKLIDKEKVKSIISQLYSRDNALVIYNKMLIIDSLIFKDYLVLSKIIRKELTNSRRYTGIHASILSFYYRMSRSINTKVNHYCKTLLPVKKRSTKRGISIAFVGIDGSGKSTVSKEIGHWLNSEFDTIKFYAGAGSGSKNPFVTLALRFYSTTRTQANRSNDLVSIERKTKNLRVIKDILKKTKQLVGAIVYYKILKDNVRKICLANKYCIEGGFCIMDRFPQNSITNDHDGPKIIRYIEDNPLKIVKKLAYIEKELFEKIENNLPKFDLLFRMNVSPEEALKRKMEDKLEILELRAKSLRTICFSANSIIDVNADNSLQEVLLFVKEKIWEAL